MLRLLLVMLAVLLCLGGCFRFAEEVQKSAAEGEVLEADAVGITRLLVLGRDRAAGLTDSIFIVTVEENNGTLRILQIPRDTYAEYTQRDYKKLNGAYGTLGLGGVKNFLSEALGVPLDYVLAMDLDCVSELVDAVGGVDVELTQPMSYSDPEQGLVIDLPAGMQRLDGSSAEHYLRYRSGYANADLGRMDAQKRFIAAFSRRCRELGKGALMGVLWKLFPHVETDLPIHRATSLVQLLLQCNADELPMLTAPGQAVQGTSGAWYYSINRAGMIRAVRDYLLPTAYTDSQFDPNGYFDREEHSQFHEIYTAPDGG